MTHIYTIGRIFLHSSSASPLFGRSGYPSPIIRLAVLALPPAIKCLIAVKCLCISFALNYFVSTSARFSRVPTLAKTKCFIASHSCIHKYRVWMCFILSKPRLLANAFLDESSVITRNSIVILQSRSSSSMHSDTDIPLI